MTKAVTLETLRADYVAALAVFDIHESMEPDEAIIEIDKTCCHPSNTEFVLRIFRTAKLYIIARDSGLEAAMLYKLSDGAIDPRNPDA